LYFYSPTIYFTCRDVQHNMATNPIAWNERSACIGVYDIPPDCHPWGIVVLFLITFFSYPFAN
jgi:hypothetical protein